MMIKIKQDGMNIVRKIIHKFNKLRQDKKDHFYAGILIGFPMVLTFGWLGGVLSLIFFALKEIVNDKILKKENAEVMDFIASAIPIVLFIILKIM